MPVRVAILSLSLALTGVWVAKRAATTPSPAVRPGPAVRFDHPAVRDVRVLIASGVPRIRLRADSEIRALTAEGNPVQLPGSPFELTAGCPGEAGVWVESAGLCTSEVTLIANEQEFAVALTRGEGWLDEIRYPGSLRVAAREGGLDLINVVDVERYTAGVVAREIWPTFATAAFRAQAIAARSFVLFQMQRRNQAAYDVVATQGAQVYRGLRDDEVGRRAEQATQDTRGLVLTYEADGADRLFCTYYSAACGGISQSAAIFGEADDVPPLRGGVVCDYCRIAPDGTYRWGPVRIKLDDVRRGLIGAYPELESWRALRDLAVSASNETGRILSIRLVSDEGRTLEIPAERFRLLLGGMDIRSTAFGLRVKDGTAYFENGQGFGHGLGLCQWGMQAQAVEGRRAADILTYYYPESKLTRVY